MRQLPENFLAKGLLVFFREKLRQPVLLELPFKRADGRAARRLRARLRGSELDRLAHQAREGPSGADDAKQAVDNAVYATDPCIREHFKRARRECRCAEFGFDYKI